MPPERAGASCPSAQPDMDGARIFGVVGGTPEEPRIGYLQRQAVVDGPMLARLGSVPTIQVFRFAASCEESRCVHFDGAHCSLAKRIVRKLEPVVDALPSCLVRATCRWYAEQGGEVCRRCPQVITMIPRADDKLNEAALPPASS